MIKIFDCFQRKLICFSFFLRMALDPNDPEVKESLKYLVLPTEEKLKLRSQAFDAKKACWVPDAKEVYVAADIVEVKGDQTIVQNSRGEVRSSIIKYFYKEFFCLDCDS
jgi:hypothetical protein